MKLKISVVTCPECNLPMLASDLYDTKLSIAECENCEKEYEVRQVKTGLDPIIKEKKVS